MANTIYPSPLAEELSYEQIKYGLKIHNPYGVPEVAHNRCCEEAIKCIEKLEKIEQIAEKYNSRVLPREAMNIFMKDVLEVIEDGNK